jgi:hypothetical protein
MNCATMSEVNTIKDELRQAFQQLGAEDIPSSNCTGFDEGGSWEGWVLYGRKGKVKLTQHCGPRIEFGKSLSRSGL